MNNKLSKLMGLLLAASLLLGGIGSAFAANSYTPVAGPSAVTITEKLYLEKEDTLVPQVSYTITVSSSAVDASGAAVPTADYSGSPSVTTGTVSFAPGDSVQGSGDNYSRYVEGAFVIDMSGVSFKRPGVYRFAITKTQSAANSDIAVSNNNASTKFVEVYVEDDTEGSDYKLKQTTIINSTSEETSGTAEGKNMADHYPAVGHDLTVSKTVTGNQGLKDKYFTFTITLSSGVEGASYAIDYSNADAVIDSAAQPASITIGSDGTGQAEVKLMHAQSVKVADLPYGIGYSVTESDNADYTVSTELTSEDANTGDSGGTGGSAIATGSGVATVADSYSTADATVAYTNDKTGTIPTGIILSAGPAAAATLIAGAGMIAALLMKKRRDGR